MADVTKKITVAVEAVVGNSASTLNNFVKSTKDVESNLKGVAGASDVASTALGVFTGTLAADVAKAFGSAIADIAIQIKNLGLETQQTIAKIGAMKNYIGDATQAYQYFNDVGRNTNYDLGAVQQMGAQLLNMGYSAQNAAAMIQLCADTAAGLNQGQAGAQQLIDTLSRIQATGEMSSRQLISLQTAGMDLDKAFASVGMSAKQAMKAMDDGTLDAQTAIKALTDYMHEFDGSMAKSKDNLTDMWGDVSGNVQTAMGEIGASIADAFSQSGIVQELVDITQDFVDFVRGDGCGAFQDFKAIASEVLNFVGGLLTFVLDIVKLIIVAVSDVYSAFKSFGSQVVAAIQPAVDAVMTLYNAVKSVLSSVGMAFHSEVGRSWKKTFGPDPDDADSYAILQPNKFKQRAVGGGGGGGGSAGGGGGSAGRSSAASQMSAADREEERALDSLVKKYTNWTKFREDSTKHEIAIMKQRAQMLTGEAAQEEDRKVKLLDYKSKYDELMDQYEKELDLTNKIADANDRKTVHDRIAERIRDAKELYDLQVQTVQYQENLKNQQANTKSLMGGFLQDPDSVKQQLDKIKTTLTDSLAEIDSALAQPVDSEQLSAVAQILGKTPDALQEEMDAKGTTIQEFMDNYKNQLVEAAEAESNQLKNSQIWKDTMKRYWNDVGKSLGDSFYDIITGAKSAGDALADFVSGSIKNALKMASEWLGLVAIFAIGGNPAPGKAASKALFGMNFATGGYVAGPGTGTSDSIPAMLSNGEYVIRASAVRNIGVPTLNALNTGRYHFADGGYVGGKKLEPSGIAGNLTLQVNALDASDFDNFLNLRGGAEHIQNMLQEAERRFAFNMG